MFSPLAFPDGSIFYDLVAHVPPASHLALWPFELFREPLVVLAIADGVELQRRPFFSDKRQSNGSVNGSGGRAGEGGPSIAERNVRALYQELEELRDDHAKALVHQVLVFDFVVPRKEKGKDGEKAFTLPEGVVAVPPPEKSTRTTMRTVMCDVSSLLLAEMTGLAKSFEGMHYVDSPGQTSTVRQLNSGSDPNLLSRRNSQLVGSTHASRSSSAGDRSQARMSMPVPFRGATSIVSGSGGSNGSTPNRPSTPVGRSGLSNAPASFDVGDISSQGQDSRGPSENVSSSTGRPGTAEAFRATSSQDTRVSVQGFGPGGVNDRLRSKGKGRVTIVLGSLYLQAGRWSDALRELADGATVAKALNDHIWHGKALELMVVAMILLGWSGAKFQVPQVCLPPPEKSSSSSATAMASKAEELERADPTQPLWLRNLQVLLPELLDRTLLLYSRISTEHLPPLPLAEATIRFAKMLTALHVAEDGKLGRAAFEMMVFGRVPDGVRSRTLTSSPRLTVTPSRPSIVALLFRAFPSSATELLTPVDRVVILSGIASVLGTLGYARKKAMVVRELVSVLVGGLVDARTRGAAEMGIHPAAGLLATQQQSVKRAHGAAAALDLGEADVEHGIHAFLGMLCETYGIVGFDVQPRGSGGAASDAGSSDAESDKAIIARIERQSAARSFGSRAAKLDVLRACINFSEALPDFHGVVRFSSDLLRTAGSGIAPGPRREDASPIISRDEQVRLAANISKTTNLALRMGLPGQLASGGAEYWDEFLVRGIALEPLEPARTPVAHARSLLPAAAAAATETAAAAASRTSQDVNPFIYNPFLKQPDKAAVEHTLIAGETAVFKVTVQNPFEIDVEVESLRLDSEGVEFESSMESAVIGPYRTQLLYVSGTPKAAGALKITGAIVKVRGCRERRFPIFVDPWAPDTSTKVKAIGLESLRLALSTPSPSAPLKTEHLAMKVIAPQPLVAVKSTSLPQSSVMILAGERQTFSVTLQNLSRTVPADFVLFSFQDSTQAPLQAALAGRDATPAELYEYELALARRQALKLHTTKGARDEKDGGRQDPKRYIAPGETATFEFEILGKPGLTHAVVQIDYAYLGRDVDKADVQPSALVGDQFYTRQVSLRLTVTVNASVDLVRMDVLPLGGAVSHALCSQAFGSPVEEGHHTPMLSRDYCLLAMDLRNAWPASMFVTVETTEPPVQSTKLDIADRPTSGGVRVREPILPGNTLRIVVPIRRASLLDPYAPIPAINPARAPRQFVVSTAGVGAERAARETFWFREHVLGSVRARWETTAAGGGSGHGNVPGMRRGDVELRVGTRLEPRMIDALRVDDVDISISVDRASASDDSSDEDDGSSRAPGSSAASASDDAEPLAPARPTVVHVDDFLCLRVRVRNLSTTRALHPVVRVVPALRHRPPNVALDYTRKFAWNGALQQTLPLLRPARPSRADSTAERDKNVKSNSGKREGNDRDGGRELVDVHKDVAATQTLDRRWAGHETYADLTLGVTPLCRGEFEISATVEEVRLVDAPDGDDGDGTVGGTKGRPRSDTDKMLDAVLGAPERRIWHAREPCLLVVRDRSGR